MLPHQIGSSVRLSFFTYAPSTNLVKPIIFFPNPLLHNHSTSSYVFFSFSSQPQAGLVLSSHSHFPPHHIRQPSLPCFPYLPSYSAVPAFSLHSQFFLLITYPSHRPRASLTFPVIQLYQSFLYIVSFSPHHVPQLSPPCSPYIPRYSVVSVFSLHSQFFSSSRTPTIASVLPVYSPLLSCVSLFFT